jgi:hypothetical protein
MILDADRPKYKLESYPVQIRSDIQSTMHVFRFEDDNTVGYGCQLEQRKDGIYRSITTELHDSSGRAIDEAYKRAGEFSPQERLL